jgi:uncharacterized membrane-anchored protein
MKKQLFYAFIFSGIVVQFAVLTSNIILQETILRKGTVCRFQTAPVDPFDAFRGQYVALRFNVFEGTGWWSSDHKGRWRYVQIGTDTNGFATVERVSDKRDVQSPYLKVRLKWGYHVEVPFNRYYMPDHLAPEAEKAYLEANRRGKRDAAAVVRIWKGKAVIEDLEIDGVPVREFLKQREKHADDADNLDSRR